MGRHWANEFSSNIDLVVVLLVIESQDFWFCQLHTIYLCIYLQRVYDEDVHVVEQTDSEKKTEEKVKCSSVLSAFLSLCLTGCLQVFFVNILK